HRREIAEAELDVLGGGAAGVALDLLEHRRGLVLRAAGEDDVRTAPRELLRGDLADAGVGAGPDEYLVRQIVGHGRQHRGGRGTGQERAGARVMYASICIDPTGAGGRRERQTTTTTPWRCASARKDPMKTRTISTTVLLAASLAACGGQ